MSYVGNTPTQQAFSPVIDYFSGNASTIAFTLSRPVASVAQVQVVVNNVAQNPASAYTVSSNTITFTSAPSTGTNNIYVYYTSPITQVIAPGQGTVTTTSLNSTFTLPAANGGTGLTSPGTAGNLLTSTGSAWASSAPPSGGFSNMVVLTSDNASYSIPATKIKVTVVGGGGAGTAGGTIGCTGLGGGAGGGGGTAVQIFSGLTIGNTLNITVGTAGNTSSVASGTQSITTVSATAGAAGTAANGGTGTSGIGGTGGVGSGGLLNIGGSGGGNGDSMGVGSNAGSGGVGGNSSIGGGGLGGIGNGNGSAGRNYGGGGGGGGGDGDGFTGSGGAGAGGVVIVEY
jgi:hypothetical protein